MKLQITITRLENVLKEERKQVAKGKLIDGAFGINACKESIKWKVEYCKQTLEEVYVELIKRALTEFGFNTLMIVACELMIEEQNK